MKQQFHPADECLMAAKDRPVELAALDGRRSAKAARGVDAIQWLVSYPLQMLTLHTIQVTVPVLPKTSVCSQGGAISFARLRPSSEA